MGEEGRYREFQLLKETPVNAIRPIETTGTFTLHDDQVIEKIYYVVAFRRPPEARLLTVLRAGLPAEIISEIEEFVPDAELNVDVVYNMIDSFECGDSDAVVVDSGLLALIRTDVFNPNDHARRMRELKERYVWGHLGDVEELRKLRGVVTFRTRFRDLSPNEALVILPGARYVAPTVIHFTIVVEVGDRATPFTPARAPPSAPIVEIDRIDVGDGVGVGTDLTVTREVTLVCEHESLVLCCRTPGLAEHVEGVTVTYGSDTVLYDGELMSVLGNLVRFYEFGWNFPSHEGIWLVPFYDEYPSPSRCIRLVIRFRETIRTLTSPIIIHVFNRNRPMLQKPEPAWCALDNPWWGPGL